MKTTDLFKINRTSKRLNESMFKTFGRKLNLETFTIEQLEDARNKLRTQIYTARSSSGFNENIENDALTQAQWMHDAIVSELMDRNEPIVDSTQITEASTLEDQVASIMKKFDEDMNEIGGYGMPDEDKIVEMLRQGDVEGALDYVYGSYADQDGGELRNMDAYIEDLEDSFEELSQGGDESNSNEFGTFKQGEAVQNEVSPPGFKGTVKAMKKHDEIDNPFALAWHMKNKGYKSHKTASGADKNESVNTGDNMTRLREGEIQQASAIVTAKTMVDRVGRWIEELSGMENDTLLQLGDSIRDEMGQEQAKGFIEAVAPAIQAALENLKTTREALASGVRTLTGEEQPANMLGGEPGADMSAEPDAMNTGADVDMGADDEFAAAEPAAGGAEEAGREMRESINRQNRLLKVLAG